MRIRYLDPEHWAWHLHAFDCRCWDCLAFEADAVVVGEP